MAFLAYEAACLEEMTEPNGYLSADGCAKERWE